MNLQTKLSITLIAALVLIILTTAYNACSAQDIDNLFRNQVHKQALKSGWVVTDSSATQIGYRANSSTTFRYYFKLNQVVRRVMIIKVNDPDDLERLSSGLKISAWMDGYIFQSLIIPKDNFAITQAGKPNHALNIKDYTRSVHVDVRLITSRYESERL